MLDTEGKVVPVGSKPGVEGDCVGVCGDCVWRLCVKLHAATGFSPYEILHGAEPTFPAAIKEMFSEEVDMAVDEEQWDADKMAKEVFRRSVAVKERMVAAGHNIKIAQHRDTLRYARRRDGTYFRRLRKFRAWFLGPLRQLPHLPWLSPSQVSRWLSFSLRFFLFMSSWSTS